MQPLITLTTDFGTRDPYAAAMKGVVLSICRNAEIIDLSHDLDSFDIYNCACFIYDSISYFPEGSVHVIVVDPGVGTDRKPVAAVFNKMYFLCPDNGLLTFFIKEHPDYSAYEITNPDYILPDISSTFHGRDIFAPAAAHIASGCRIEESGRKIDNLVTIELPEPVIGSQGIINGKIINIDKFGNCISNIHRNMTGKIKKIIINEIKLHEVKNTFSDEKTGKPFAVWGSRGYLEVAINMGNAAKQLNIKTGDLITIL